MQRYKQNMGTIPYRIGPVLHSESAAKFDKAAFNIITHDNTYMFLL